MSSRGQGPESASRRAVGEHFRRLRRSLSWTLQDVAERVSRLGIPVSHSTLSRIEQGRTTISADLLIALGETLGASFEEIEEIMRVARTRVRVDLTGSDPDELMECAAERVRAGDYPAALEQFRAARDHLLLGPDTKDRDARLADIMLYEAECHRRLRQFALSLRLAGRVLNLEQLSEENRFRALVLHVQALFQTGDFFQARLFGRQVAARLDRMPPRRRALGLGVLAALEYKQERWREAIPLFEEARRLYRGLGIEVEVSRMGVGLGYALYRSGDARRGERIVVESLETARKESFGDVEFLASLILGRIATDRRDRQAARHHLDHAAEIASRLGLPHEEFIAVYEFWTCCRILGDTVEGRRRQRRLSRLLKKIDGRLPEARSFLRQITTAEPPGEHTS